MEHHYHFLRGFTVVAVIVLVVLTVLAVLLIRFLLRKLKGRKQVEEREEDLGRDQQFSESLAQTLKNWRMAHGMTQEQVAAALEISRQAVSKWENGTAEPSTSNLLALAKLYGVDLNDLVGNIGEK